MRCKWYGGRLKPSPPRPLIYELDIFLPFDGVNKKPTPERSLTVQEEFVESTSQKGPDELVKEYLKIDPYCYSDGESHTAFKTNMHKNRYSDVICVDSTRVKLRIDVENEGDYIHASYIRNPLLHSKFICTQGPLSTTIYDFWRMVFQERAESIVMLCRPTEDGRQKCSTYWPEAGKTLKWAALTVTNVGEEEEFSTVTLLVELNKDVECPELSEKERNPLYVRLHRWTSWPDRGVPDETSCRVPLQLLERIRKGPAVIHCSAGIGRTGSMMVLEIALRKIAQGKKINIEQITRELRKSRCQCVQTEVQYLYIHRVLVEHALGHVNLDEKCRAAGKKFLEDLDARMTK